VTFGSDCTVWDEERKRFCGALAILVRRDGQSGAAVHVICDRHRRAGDQPFPVGAGRATQSTIHREWRFTRSGAA
jgi:hypothetical protein